MIIDCRSQEFRLNNCVARRRVFVDGVEVNKVFYVDTEAGIARTYDVLGDGNILATHALSHDLKSRGQSEGWDMPLGGAVNKAVHGQVDLRPFE